MKQATSSLSTDRKRAGVDRKLDIARTSGGLHNEFVKSEAFAASFGDSSTSSFGEAEGSNVKLWHVEGALVIGDGANANGGSVGLLAKVLDDLGD